MSDKDDVERRLRTLAAEPVPSADPTFVERLDVHLRVLHVDELGASRSRSTWIPALMGLAAVILLAVASGLLLNRASNDAVILIAASDTDIIVPGDEAAAARAGLHLPDGTRIIVGDEGEAVVNGVVLGPGSEAMVVGDEVDIIVTDGDPTGDGVGSDPLVVEGDGIGDRDRSSETTISDGTSDNGSTTTDAAVDGGAATDRQGVGSDNRGDDNNGDDGSGDGGGATTVVTRDQSSSTPSTSPPSTATTSTVREPTTTSTTSRTSSTANDQRPAPLTLTVTLVDRTRLRLDWTLNRDVAPAGWRVRVRRGDRMATVVAIRDGNARSATIERSIAVDGSVWVEALDRQGRVLLASDPIEIDD